MQESAVARGCKWAFSGARPGHPSGYQPELTDYKLDTRNWTLVDVESDRYVGDEPCASCHWFVRSAPVWIKGGSTVVFHTCRSGDEVWTLIPKDPSLCPLDVGGDAYDTDGLGRGCMNMYSFHVRCGHFPTPRTSPRTPDGQTLRGQILRTAADRSLPLASAPAGTRVPIFGPGAGPTGARGRAASSTFS